jgi:hypothetical protein
MRIGVSASLKAFSVHPWYLTRPETVLLPGFAPTSTSTGTSTCGRCPSTWFRVRVPQRYLPLLVDPGPVARAVTQL